MSISDPCGILQRVPELQELIFDAKIRHAIETGDPFRIYRALMLARLLRRLPQQRELLLALTRERRLFARPLKGTPSLGTINSVGLSFVGEAEKDEEGYHIALHAFVMLFAIPIIPLGAYLVRKADEKQWQIFARVPLGMAGWLYTRGLALLLVLSVLGGAVHSWSEAGEHDVLLLNGFPKPVAVNLNGQTFTVPANGRSTVRLKIGPMQGKASIAGVGEVDQIQQELRFGKQKTIWNIAGTAPLTSENLTYYKQGAAPQDEKVNGKIYCGESFVELDNVDYLFTRPPEQISMSKYEDTRVVSYVNVHQDEKNPKLSGVELCSDFMLGGKDVKRFASALEAMAVLQNWEERAIGVAIFSAQAASPERAVRLAKRVVKAKPEFAYMQMYRSIAEMAGQEAQAAADFAALLRKEPDNADYHYLNATILSGEARKAALQAVAKRFPQHAPSLVSLSWQKLAMQDYQGALQDVRHLRQVAPDAAYRAVDTEVTALLALNQGKAALQRIHAYLSDPNAYDQVRHAVDYALLARQLGQPDPEQWMRVYGDPQKHGTSLYAQRARLGLAASQSIKATDPGSQSLVRLSEALLIDPKKALQLASNLAPIGLRHLAEEQTALLYCEALRTQNKPLVQALRWYVGVRQTEFAKLEAYVRGQPGNLEGLNLEPVVQAAAHLSRARQADLPSAERDKLRKMAYQLDFLHGNISIALEKWPQS